MSLPFELMLGLRYTRTGRGAGRKNGFISFISATSTLSIALGVAALIVVLSVMNGFQKEVRDRMLSVISHVEVVARNGRLEDWTKIDSLVRRDRRVVATAPYVSGQALATAGSRVTGVMVRGIDPKAEPSVTSMASTVSGEGLESLVAGSYNIILGADLAHKLGVAEGARLALVLPDAQRTLAGMIPRVKQVTVTGLLSSGHYEYDSTMAMMALEDAAKLFRTGGPSGVRLRLEDMHEAPAVAQALNRILPRTMVALDWSWSNRTWFAAVQVEKRMMGVILFLIVLVGAFGLVSSMVMTVTEKQSDIAILRTLGASPASIMATFVVQGTIVGFLGVVSGLVLGLLVAHNLDPILSFVESLAGVKLIPREIYFISTLPSDPRMGDIVPICILSFVLSIAATLYPSWRAARTRPAEALRYE